MFLGGAVLANLVRFTLSVLVGTSLTLISDRRQGRYVGKQAGVGRARCACLRQAGPPINGLYLGGSLSAHFPFDLLRIVLQALLPFSFPLTFSSSPNSPLSKYTRQYGFLSLLLETFVDLSSADRDGTHDTKEHILIEFAPKFPGCLTKK